MGVKIFSDASVNAIGRRGDRFSLQTGAGSVKADRVLLCTNGYTDPSLGPIGRSFASIPSIQIATDPLPASLRDLALSLGRTGGDHHRPHAACP